jgi:hypothetical protein
MSERFADSFVFLAMLNRQDRRHTAAVEALYASRDALVTTAWVLTELADGLCAANSRAVFVTLERRLREDARVTIVVPSERLYEAGLELYRQRSAKDWSLTDCISFVVMRERGIVEALTGDRHFEQAGFVAVLR